MWSSCSSNPLRIPEGTARAAALAAIVLAAGALPAAGQPQRQVVTELRIAPGSTHDRPQLTAPEVRAAAEQRMAEIGGKEFLFLEWLPAARATGSDAPRFTLSLADGPQGDCDPPRGLATFSARRQAAADWTSREIELSALCDLAALEWSAEEFLARVAAVTETLLRDPEVVRQLQAEFFSKLVLATELAPDLAARKLYLPFKGLRASRESEIEVRFQNRADQLLLAYPGDVEQGRTQLLVGSFLCGDIQVDATIAAGLHPPWHPRLPELLAACRDPFVYMRRYAPNRVEIDLASGIETDFGEGEPR